MSRGHAVRTRTPRAARRETYVPRWDWPLLGSALALAVLGLVMVASSSISTADRLGAPLMYFNRQLIYVGLGMALAAPALWLPLEAWRRAGPALLLLAIALLAMVLIPGVGREVNGSTRWIDLGLFNFQVSEAAKLLILIYLAGYLVRHGQRVRTEVLEFAKPVGVVMLAAALLLLEPDFGAAAVLLGATLAMLFLAGVKLWQFGILVVLFGGAMAGLAYGSPYRWARVVSFMNPWEDPFNSGFQLVQSLIAFGRGEWWGVGLGGSVQKLFYLPEAHTDFLFAVLAEELGLLGSVTVIALFAVLVWRIMRIGARAERAHQPFAAYLAYGIGTWLGLQALINVGVNMGVLPTKGLTLPLMSYGGSSMLMVCMALAMVLRIHFETAQREVLDLERRRRA